MIEPLQLDIDPLASSPLPVDLDLIKTHAAIDGTDFDTLLPVYLFAAIDWAENAMHRTIFARPHRWILWDFPHADFKGIRLPRGKAQSVEKIEYVAGGQTVTLTGPSSDTPGTDYREDLRNDAGGLVMPLAGQSWPSVDYDTPAPVTIHFTAGWQADEVPSQIIHALLFAVSDAFENRGSADLGSNGANLLAREALISSYRLVRFYA